MADIKVSVLVPVYNVERYVKECLDSLIKQTLPDIEIICIDDGSTDLSGQILDEYENRYSKIRVIHKSNSGYGDSMNLGLSIAMGEYIGIVESDDFVKEDMFEKLYQIAEINKCDMVKGDYYRLSQKTQEYCEVYKQSEYNKVFSKDDNLSRFSYTNMSIWTGIYKKEFLEKNEIQFLASPGASFQDISFLFKVFVSLERGMFIRTPFVFYRTDNVSSSVKDKKKVYCVCDEIAECHNYLNKYPEKKKFRPYLVKMSYLIYKWNLDRISAQEKKNFINTISLEYKNWLCDNAVDKSLFQWDEWIQFESIAIAPNKYDFSKAVLKEIIELTDNLSIYKEGLFNLLNRNRELYIYGNGVIGKMVLEFRDKANISSHIEFIVTDCKEAENKENVHCIFDNGLNINRPVLVAVKDNLARMQCIELLSENRFANIYVLDDYMIAALKL